MTPVNPSKGTPDCPVCGRGVLEDRRIEDSFEFRTEDGLIQVHANDVPVRVCPACGETLSGPEAARVHHAAICRALGLLVPEEIRGIREKLGMTQAELARLTGIGEATISRWERGRLLQNRGNDRYLRLLANAPQAVGILEGIIAAAPEVTFNAAR
jgi:putative zinc finger/helix-turn-helix YgiT family protein